MVERRDVFVSSGAQPRPEQIEQQLIEDIAGFYADPLGFVLYAFAWGEGDLEGFDGPDDWQRDFLILLGEEVEDRGFDGVHAVLPILMAVGSGHGVGKSALVAWIILWIMSTRPQAKGTVTASTVTQLKTKTVPELKKWLKRSINSHWFDSNDLMLHHVEDRDNWRVDFQTSRKENSEAFAGQHNVGSTSFYVFDESSGVPDEIFEVADGGLTDGEPMWFCFGNRTKPKGRFNDCFTRFKHRWLGMVVDSRTARFTNKVFLKNLIEDWGVDHDVVRVRVLGLAPSAAAEQLISVDVVEEARKRLARANVTDPLVMGIDVARYGTDRSVFAFRKGRDARTHGAKFFHGISLMDLADAAAADIRELKPDAVFTDGGGVGGGVVDRLVQLGFAQIIEVNFGGSSHRRDCFNRRSAMWCDLRDWLKVGAIEDDGDLQDELVAQDFHIDAKTRNTRLVSKEDLHRLEQPSPDWGDALALTFAAPVAPSIENAGHAAAGAREERESGYDPLARLNRG